MPSLFAFAGDALIRSVAIADLSRRAAKLGARRWASLITVVTDPTIVVGGRDLAAWTMASATRRASRAGSGALSRLPKPPKIRAARTCWRYRRLRGSGRKAAKKDHVDKDPALPEIDRHGRLFLISINASNRRKQRGRMFAVFSTSLARTRNTVGARTMGAKNDRDDDGPINTSGPNPHHSFSNLPGSDQGLA